MAVSSDDPLLSYCMSAYQEGVSNKRLQCIESAFEDVQWLMQFIEICRRAARVSSILYECRDAPHEIDDDVLKFGRISITYEGK
jgi:hypothetical protein